MNTSLLRYDGQFSTTTTPIPKVSSPNDVIVKVSHCGVCGTDLHIIDGEFPAANKIIMGHEFVGVVSEAGKGVDHVKIGDRVCVNPYNFCGTCYYCARGQPQFCTEEAMHTALGFHKNGGFQQYCSVPGHLVFPLPVAMSMRDAVLIQPMAQIVRGWDNMGRIESDANILVAGAGIIGLLWASVFHYHGYREITITEDNPHRQEIASKLNLGYDVISPTEINDMATKAQENDDETWGYDVIVDCTGMPEAVEKEIGWLRKGATLVMFGCCPKGVKIGFEPFKIYAKEVQIVSSYLNKYTFPRTIKMVDHMAARYIDWHKLAIGTYKLQDYEAAFEALRKGEISKAVFEI